MRPELAAREVRLVLFAGGAKDNRPVARRTTWGALTTSLTTRRTSPEKSLTLGWSPVEYAEGARRGLAGVLSVWALVLDYDGGATIEQAREAWAPWAHIGHSSWSGPPKCRIVVPLATPCPAALWPRVFTWARQRDDRIDRSTSDASRLWFVPATSSSTDPFEAWDHDGPLLELGYEALPDPSRPAAPPPPRVDGTRYDARSRLDEPSVRAEVATRLKCAVTPSGTAKGARCPGCGRFSIWFPVSSSGAAVCNHRRTCGWVGSLLRVLEAA
jgi:hypothetical protein